MATQIAKDKIIQNAVGSTSKIRKDQGKLELAQKNGKSSISNEWVFNKGVNNYLNNDDLEQSYTGGYREYTDIKKKSLEAIKALHPNLSEFDMPYVLNADGTFNTKVYADAMKRMKVEGISEGQIKQAISASLTPDDMAQLSIDAQYQFKDFTSEDLKLKLTKDFQTFSLIKQKELVTLNGNLKNETDPEKILLIKERIVDYEELLGETGKMGKLGKTYAEQLLVADQNPDSIKFSIYKNGFIDEYANAFKWKTESAQFVTNPMKAQENFRAEMLFKQKSEAANNFYKSENLKVSQINAQNQIERTNLIRLKVQTDAFKAAQDASGNVNAPWTTVGTPTTNRNEAPKLFDESRETISNSINQDYDYLNSKGYSPAQVNKLVTAWTDSQGTATIREDLKPIIQRMVRNNNDLMAMTDWKDKLQKDSYDEVLNNPINIEKVNKELQGKPSLNLNFNGTTISLSPSEIVGIKNAPLKKPQPFRGTGTFVDLKQENFDMSKLNNNQRKFFTFKQKLDNNQNISANSSILNTINKTFSQFNQAAKNVKDIDEEANEKYLDNLSKYANAFVPRIKAVGLDTKKEIPGAILNNLRTLNESTKQKEIKGVSNYDSAVAENMLTKENIKNTTVFVKQTGGNYNIIFKNNQQGENQVFQVSKEQVVNIVGNSYVNNNERLSSKLIYGNGNTNLTGNPLQSELQKQFGDFIYINKYQITGGARQRMDNPDAYIPSINLKMKNGRYTNFQLPISTPLGYDQAISKMNNLTDETLMKELKLRYPNFDFSKVETNN
jgi:hypothetical protein